MGDDGRQHYDITEQVEQCRKNQKASLEGLNKESVVALPIELELFSLFFLLKTPW